MGDDDLMAIRAAENMASKIPLGAVGQPELGRLVSLATLRLVDGGLDPRISGGARKVGTNFAVDLLAARTRDDRPLSTPQAAGGGGQRPAFTGVYRPATIASVDLCLAPLVLLP